MNNLDSFTKEVKDLIFYLDDVQGNRLYRSVEKEIGANFDSDPEIRGAFISLQFLIIPYLEPDQISYLLKNDLYIGLGVEDMDIAERIEKRLVTEELEDRDGFKKQFRQALIENKEEITNVINLDKNRKLSTIASWLNDYIANINPIERGLSKAKYFFEKPYYKNLAADKKNRLNKIFTLYEYLIRSSYTPLGFEDDVLLKTEDGKFITTNKGEIVVLYDEKTGKIFRPEESKIHRVSGPPQTQTEKNIANLQAQKQAMQGIAGKVIDEEIDNTKKIEDLQIMANKYKDNSLQKRAIEEEIRKLEQK